MKAHWKHLLRSLVADPEQFAGGSAVSGPLGLLAVEQEHLAVPRDGFSGMPGAQGAGQGRHGRGETVIDATVEASNNSGGISTPAPSGGRHELHRNTSRQ